MTIAELAPLIESRQVSPVDVVQSLLARIERFDDLLRAYLTVTADSALAAARVAEREPYRGVLHGIPLAHKDVLWTRGVRTTAHSRVLEHFLPEEDATCVSRLGAAGAILLGKLNTNEFATGAMEWWGVARNPWHTGCFSGGSSSGSGVALAAHLTIGATGTDTGGSIRAPAAYCGVVGLKPNFGRVSRHGVIPLSPSFDCAGPMAKCVRDSAVLLQAMAGPDPRDPATLDQTVPDFAADLDKGVRGLVLGVPEDYFFEGLHPETLACARKAIAQLEAMGARLIGVRLPSSRSAPRMVYRVLSSTEAYAYHKTWLREQPHHYGPVARCRVLSGAFFTAAEIERMAALRRRIEGEFAAALAGANAIVTPTRPAPAPPLAAYKDNRDYMSSLTRPISLTGLPAISIPCGFSAAGLPIGLQIIGRPWEEATVLRIAAAYESATDWHRRRPDLLADRPLPEILNPPAPEDDMADPEWVRAYAAAHDVPLRPEDVEPVARLLGSVRAQLAEAVGSD